MELDGNAMTNDIELVVEVEHRMPDSLAFRLEKSGVVAEGTLVKIGDRLHRYRVVLSDFVGLPLSGRWILEIEDTYPGFTGALLMWMIQPR